MATLFKDVTTSGVHAPTALGNQGKGKRKAMLFSGIRKPNTGPTIDVDKGMCFKVASERHIDVPIEQSLYDYVADKGRVEKFATVIKVDESLGLVFGWAIVCKKDGEDYWDLQGDNIPEDAMLAASTEFMGSGAMAKEMHAGEAAGAILFAFPLTEDIAKAFGIETKTTGLMIAMRPADKAMLGKFRPGPNGEPPVYAGFSIGGFRVKDEEIV